MFNTTKLNESIIEWLKVVAEDTNLIITSQMSENRKDIVITSQIGDEKIITDETNGMLGIDFPTQTKLILYTSIFTIVLNSHAPIDEESRQNANILVDKLEDVDTIPIMKEENVEVKQVYPKYAVGKAGKIERGEKKHYACPVTFDIMVSKIKYKSLNIWQNKINS